MLVSVNDILQLIQTIKDQYDLYKDNDQIIECLLYRVENLNLVLRGNESKFPPELPCLSRVKSTLEETLQILGKFKKRGFLVKFFLAKSYKDDFTRLNSSLTESLNDLHFVLTAVKPDIVVDPKAIAEEIYQRLLNTLPEYVCSNFNHLNDLVDMIPIEQNALVDLMVEHQSLEREPILTTLAQLKEQKAQNPAAFQRSAAQKLSSSFSVKAGPPLPANTLLPVAVDSRIGEGTFGSVYQGSQTSTGELVAVKFIQVLSQTDKKMFEREVGSLKRLSECPYVVKYHGWIESILDPITLKSCVAILLEYCPRSLASIVLNFDLDPPLSEWIRYLHQIAVGMRHLSLMGVIHRDLKPDNILIKANNEIAITDFGLSITKSSIQRMSASQKLAAAGTIGYMAPEEEASEFSDIYAYGVIMSFVLNRAEPWVDNRGKALVGAYLQQATRSRLPRLVTKEMFPECSESFLQLIARCCAQLPWQRPRFVEIEEIVKCTIVQEKSDPFAEDLLKQGLKYYKGEDVDLDFAEAVKWFRKAAEKGDAGAMYHVGVCYENGRGVSQDYAEAVRWYRQAAEKGHADAMVNLGVCYGNGRGVSQDYVEAVRWFRQAAEKGDADAMVNLGVCYENGQGVSQDLAEAVRWYRQAAEKGNADAMYGLGLCYENGQGVSKDLSQALRLYEQAAGLGNLSANDSFARLSILMR